MNIIRNALVGWLMLAGLLPCAAVAATKCLPLKVGDRSGNYIIPGSLGNIPYRRTGQAALEMDAYVHQSGGRRPAVVIVHGGGWDTGSRRSFTGQLIDSVTSAGFNWFAIDYRKNGLRHYDEAVEDLLSAIDFIRCHADELQVDTGRIAIAGEDSGAHIAVLAAIRRPETVSALALLGGFYDLTESPQLANGLRGMLKDEAAEFLRKASPSSMKKAGMPAVLIVHGTVDSESPLTAARRYCNDLTAAGRSCQLLEVENGIHRPENWRPAQWDYKYRMIGWLKSRLGGEDLTYKPITTNLTRNIVYEARHDLRLDAWRPAGKGPFPAVILVHGGGWEAGDKITYITPLFEPLARAGFAWFSIDYRLTPAVRHPQQLEDLRTAIRFVHANAKRFDIDPGRIAVIGESASGQMVAQIATEKLPELAAAVSFYGVYDFLPMARQINPRSIPARLFGIRELDKAADSTLRRYSPLYNAEPGQTPLLLICGNKDGLYAQHTVFVERLRAIGAIFDELTVEGAPHGVENWEGHPDRQLYKSKLVEWLKSKFSDGSRK